MHISFKFSRSLFAPILAGAFILTGCSEAGQLSSSDIGSSETEAVMTTVSAEDALTEAPAPETRQQISLTDTDGSGSCYEFIYCGEIFRAEYTPDNWKIIDSYRITDTEAITAVCNALAEVHPIYSKDGSAYRTPEDMAYEWEQHNIAYQLLPEDSPYKENAKDVDLNPEDQGKSIIDFALEQIG